METQNTKNIEQMTRTEVIDALRSYCRPDQYHFIITWPTKYLKALLVWYIGLKVITPQAE